MFCVAVVFLGFGCEEDEAVRAAREDALRRKPPVQTGSLNQAMASERVTPTLPTPQDEFLTAVRKGDKKEAQRWIERGAVVEDGAILVVAVRGSGDVELVRWLVERGAPVDQADSAGRSPLSWACGKRRSNVLSFLLKAGASIEQPDQLGRTPLHYAVFSGDAAVVAKLVDAGARVDVQDRLGTTPLMYACAKELPGVVEVLDAAKASWDLRDNLGRTARERAHGGIGACRQARDP